jgi:hypothetical protein
LACATFLRRDDFSPPRRLELSPPSGQPRPAASFELPSLADSFRELHLVFAVRWPARVDCEQLSVARLQRASEPFHGANGVLLDGSEFSPRVILVLGDVEPVRPSPAAKGARLY